MGQPNAAFSRHPLVIEASDLASTATSLEELHLHQQRMDLSSIGITSKPVPATSTAQASPIAILGKSPAATEVETGSAYAGPAGQVLRTALRQAGEDINLYHLTYATHWRPRKNNTPNATQLAISLPFLEAEMEIIQPRKILVLGAAATSSLLGEHPDFDDDTEIETEWCGIPTVVIRNNGYVLRNPHLAKAYAETLSRHGYHQEIRADVRAVSLQSGS